MDPAAPVPIAPVPIERLLEHRVWVRTLARALVGDANRADDVEQDAWLAAMTHPPRHADGLKTWLGRLVRHRASNARRAETRRGTHERAVFESTRDADPSDAVARIEELERVVRAVLALEEPYRSTVVLRFYEDLDAHAIAARTGAPVETVRTRLKRALAQLRGRLDDDRGGDGRAWCAALLPLAGARSPIESATTGAMLMAGKTKLVAASAAVLLLAGAAAMWPKSPARVAPSTDDAGAIKRPSATRPRATEPASAQSAAVHRVITLRGVVADADTKTPIEGARVVVVTKAAGASTSAATATTDASGRYELAAPPGRVLVRAEKADWYQPFFPADDGELGVWRAGAQHFDRNAVDVTADAVATLDVFLLRTGGVEGQVLLVDGAPVPAAEVVVRPMTAGAPPTRGVADADGRFRIVAVAPGPKLWIDASKPGLMAAEPTVTAVDAERSTTGIVVRMRKMPVVAGRIVSAAGKPLAGASVQIVVVADSRDLAWGPNGEWTAWSGAQRTPVRPDGTYEVPWPIRGEFLVRASCPGHRPARSDAVAFVEGREAYRVDLTLAPGATLAGRVVSAATGAAIPGARVAAGPATNPVAKVTAPLTAVCDADGRFVFDSLTAETWLVSATAEGYVEGRAPPAVAPTQDVSLALASEMSIAGVVRLGGKPLAGAVVGVQAQQDDALELFDYYVKPFADAPWTADDGSFRVKGLVSGTYRLYVRPPQSAKSTFRATLSAPVAAGSNGVVVDVEPLAANETVDAYAWMTDDVLGCDAAGRNLQKDYDAALARWRSLLARQLTSNRRAAALIEYANTLAGLGRRDDQETALHDAIDLAGASSVRGLTAQSRLAWSKYWAGDARAALELIRPVTQSPDVVQSAGARWSSAKFAAKTGDVAGARATLTALRAEIADAADSRLRQLLPQTEKSLAELAGR